MYMHNWCHSSISGILYTHGHKLQCTTIHGAFPLLLSPLTSSPFLPLCVPFYLLGTLLAVTGSVHLVPRLLVTTPLFPHLALVPSHPKSRPPLGFPDPNMHLIRTTLRTQPISSQTVMSSGIARGRN
jgi:hypothetical protein